MKSSIWAPKGLTGRACVQIPYKGYEISIAMDDSCGTLPNYSRTDIRVYHDVSSMDVTYDFFRGDEYMLYGDAETLQHIFKTIDNMETK